MEDKIVVGLDIGTTKICAIAGRKNEFGKLEVLGYGKAVSEGVMRGIVTNIDKTVYAIKKAISDCEESSGIKIGEVNVGIAGNHIRSNMHHGSIMRDVDTEGEEVTVNDIRRLIQEQYKFVTSPGSEIIHVMPQTYTVDFEGGIKDPVGMVGVRLESDFHVITAQTTAIANINKCVKRGGVSHPELNIDNLILEPIASSLSVLSEEDKEAGVVLIDIGGGTTDIAIFYEGIIRHTAVIPFGGDIITSDIKQGCAVMQQQAEKLKVTFGRAIADEAKENEIVSIPVLRNRPPKEISIKNLAYIIESRMKDIIELVDQEVIKSGYKSMLAAGMVITGGGAQLKNVCQLFEYITGLDCQIGMPNEHLGKSKFEDVKSPAYATTIGLVLAGFQALDDRENHYTEFKKQVAGNKVIKKDKGSELLRNLIDKTKRIFLDDIDNSDY